MFTCTRSLTCLSRNAELTTSSNCRSRSSHFLSPRAPVWWAALLVGTGSNRASLLSVSPSSFALPFPPRFLCPLAARQALTPLCEDDNQSMEIIQRLQKNLDILIQSMTRVSSRSEMLGAIHQVFQYAPPSPLQFIPPDTTCIVALKRPPPHRSLSSCRRTASARRWR